MNPRKAPSGKANSPKIRRSKHLTITLTPEERRRVAKAAEQACHTSSSWARIRLLQAAEMALGGKET